MEPIIKVDNVSMWVGVHMFRKTQDRFVLHI